MDKSLIVIIIQIILVFAFIAIITMFIRFNNSIKLEKRIARYSVKYNSARDNLSTFDKILRSYLKFVKKQRKKMKKLFPTLAIRYDKYVTVGDVKAIDFVTHKFVLSVIFMVLTIVAMAIQGRFITMIQILISFGIGFYILDIILYIINKSNKKKIENDMLRAIIIINNAFKSGKSTIQAIEIASKKLPKPIGQEFKRIHSEMKYGLSMDVVFDRFAKRINIPEAEYLSSSLTILNKTGGNIIAVFDSIEKTLFDKKKLKEELKNSTTVSKLVVKLLLLVPIFFVLIIYMLNPGYFQPFFDSALGYLLLIIIIIMFILYAYLLQRIAKVDY